MCGGGINRIQLSDKKKKKKKKHPHTHKNKRHNELSDGGTKKFHLVSKVHNEKSASTN